MIAAFWLRTGGSVWPGILVHGMTNYWSTAIAPTANRLLGTDVRNIAVLALAVILLVVLGRRLGDRQAPVVVAG
ncbi:MAG: hypothetical protein ABI647_05295 [Gemmatimonadota bacterium]